MVDGLFGAGEGCCLKFTCPFWNVRPVHETQVSHAFYLLEGGELSGCCTFAPQWVGP